MNRAITIFISFLLTIVIGLVLVWPKYQDFKSLQTRISQKRAELQSQEEYFSNLQKISEELSQYSDSLQKIDTILPLNSDLPAVFNFLEKTASQSGLILKSLGLLESPPQPEGSEIKTHFLMFSLLGPYPSFKNFLLTLEKSARLIETESISFSVSEGRPTYKLKIKFYSY